MSHDLFDPNAIKAKVAQAFAAETQYQLVNSAKLQAVAQNMDYDGFRGMVLGASLEPMNLHHNPLDQIAAGSRLQAKASESAEDFKEWTSQSKQEQKNQHLTQQLLQAEQKLSLSPPLTVHEFERDWSRHCQTAQERVRYLELLDEANIPTVFKSDISPDILSQIILALDEYYQGCEIGDAARLFSLLRSLAALPRFELSAAFLGAKDKQHATTLFDKLLSLAPETAPEPAPTSSPAVPAAASTKPTTKKSTAKTPSAYPMLLPGWGPAGAARPKKKKVASTSPALAKSSFVWCRAGVQGLRKRYGV